MKNKPVPFKKITIGVEIYPGITVVDGPFWEKRKASSGREYKYKFYDIKCFCGIIKRMRDSHVRSGLITSCGCKRGAPYEEGVAATNLAVFSFRTTLAKRKFTSTLSDEEIIDYKSKPCVLCGEKSSCVFGESPKTGYFHCNTIDRYDNNQTKYEVGCIITTCRACNSGHRVMTVPAYLKYAHDLALSTRESGTRYSRIYDRLLNGDIHRACKSQKITLPPLHSIIGE